MLVHLDTVPEAVISWLGWWLCRRGGGDHQRQIDRRQAGLFRRSQRCGRGDHPAQFAALVNGASRQFSFLCRDRGSTNGDDPGAKPARRGRGAVRRDRRRRLRARFPRPADPLADFRSSTTSGTTRGRRRCCGPCQCVVGRARQCGPPRDADARRRASDLAAAVFTNAQAYSVLASLWRAAPASCSRASRPRASGRCR